jgi:hypothetical protein
VSRPRLRPALAAAVVAAVAPHGSVWAGELVGVAPAAALEKLDVALRQPPAKWTRRSDVIRIVACHVA